MHNITLHLSFFQSREIRSFLKLNDIYSKWSSTCTLYKNTVLPLLLIYKLLHTPESKILFAFISKVAA